MILTSTYQTLLQGSGRKMNLPVFGTKLADYLPLQMPKTEPIITVPKTQVLRLFPKYLFLCFKFNFSEFQ
jgi:hypothetical protein